MNNEESRNRLYSHKLRHVLECLDAGPGTISDIISRAFEKKFSFSRPKKDISRSLKILEIMGLIRRITDGDRHIYEKIEPAPYYESGICLISHGIEIILEQLDNPLQETSMGNLSHVMANFSSDEINLILELLENKAKIKRNGEIVYREVTVFSYKKTSDQ